MSKRPLFDSPFPKHRWAYMAIKWAVIVAAVLLALRFIGWL